MEYIESFEVFLVLSNVDGCDVQGIGSARVDIYDNDAPDGDGRSIIGGEVSRDPTSVFRVFYYFQVQFFHRYFLLSHS